MKTKKDIHEFYQQNELSQEKLLEYIVDLHYEIELLKRKPTVNKTIPSTISIPNSPNMGFQQYLKTHLLPNVEQYLNVVFENDLYSGVKHLFDNNLIENMPIFCENKKVNSIFYIFENQEWTKLTADQFKKIIIHILNEFIVIFNTSWIQTNQTNLLHDPSFYNKYMLYFEKIVGTSQMHQEKIITRVKKYLGELLKQ
jgi:hypothetical protein|uniref:Uncharacterized protein n=1 Tax=viral metagenome TaxID=1070528 RepID=A0A6C0ISC6_9ZZZZ